MSIHISAKKGDIAETILLPGDPLRAKFIAENWLGNSVCYNNVRGMYGFTGTFQGKRVSVQGTGMGMPSLSIYAHELMTLYGVKTLIRVGSCGALQPDLRLRDVILAQAASSDSAMNQVRFQGMNYAPAADWDLLRAAWENSRSKEGVNVQVGSILSTDTFYNDDPESWKLWASFGVKAVEMEAAGLYTLAAKHRCRALAILTVSDSLVTAQEMTSAERERTFKDMVEIALNTAVDFV